MATIDPHLLFRFTGQTAVSDPDYAEAVARGQAEKRNRLRAQLYLAKAEMHRRAFRAWLARTRVEPWVWSLMAATLVGFGAAILCFRYAGNRPAVVLPAMIAGFAVGAGMTYPVVRDRYGETPENRTEVRQAALSLARQRVNEIVPGYEEAEAVLARWKRLAVGIRQALEYPIVRLLNANPHAMSGDEFERYLAEIFHLLGYQVERLGGSGDQGVDLILTLGGTRTAVQAKCYSNALGNKPVQEVYAGRVIHGCHRWAVVTNNTFTTGGRQAAAATGTILIEGSQLHALILGQIRL
jgi:restriction system protein